MECIITPYFWTSLWPAIQSKPETRAHPLRYVGGQFNHSVPICLLFFDWLFFSSKPFVRRHFYISFFIAIMYLLLNFLSTKITGIPVYPAMKWSGLLGYLIPLAFIPFGTLIFFILYFITKMKLYYMGD